MNTLNGGGGGELSSRAKNFFSLLEQIIGNLINNCYFLKFIISVRGGHCDDSLQAPKYLAALPRLSVGRARHGHESYLFSKTFRPALRATQSRIQRE
jgi:hypothetical protein